MINSHRKNVTFISISILSDFTVQLHSETFFLSFLPVSESYGCPGGQEAHVSPGANGPTLCPMGGSGSHCPAGYSCAYSPETLQYLCCGGSGGADYPGQVPPQAISGTNNDNIIETNNY